jgi:hypothetical protein
MQVEKTERGFEVLKHEIYPPEPGKVGRIVQQSSVIGDYPDSFEQPGSSYLWVGDRHHLNREEVRQLITHLENWLATGRLSGEARG